MNALTKIDQLHSMERDLEETLQALRSFGCPRVAFVQNGWHASIDMHVTAVGSEFKIKTEFDHVTPTEAIEVLITRIRQALKDLS